MNWNNSKYMGWIHSILEALKEDKGWQEQIEEAAEMEVDKWRPKFWIAALQNSKQTKKLGHFATKKTNMDKQFYNT